MEMYRSGYEDFHSPIELTLLILHLLCCAFSEVAQMVEISIALLLVEYLTMLCTVQGTRDLSKLVKMSRETTYI